MTYMNYLDIDTAICPVCDGIGSVPVLGNFSVHCSKCNGTGEIEVYYNEDTDQYEELTDEIRNNY